VSILGIGKSSDKGVVQFGECRFAGIQAHVNSMPPRTSLRQKPNNQQVYLTPAEFLQISLFVLIF